MKKNTINLTESQLRNMIAESVKNVLNEKYNPYKTIEREDGETEYPRYEKDTGPYKDKLGKQAAHLYKQIEFFLQTLAHANPNVPNAKEKYNDYHRSVGGWGGMSQEVEDALERAKSKLRVFIYPDTLRGFDLYGVN